MLELPRVEILLVNLIPGSEVKKDFVATFFVDHKMTQAVL